MFSKLISDLGLFLLALNFLLFIRGYFKFGKLFKILFIYNLAMLLVQYTSLYYVKILHKNNLFLSHFYFILQFSILSIFYYFLFKNKIQKKIVFILGILVLFIIVIQYVNNIKLFETFNLLEIVITSLPLIVYATFHLYNLLNNKKEYYYFNLGLLIYLFGSTIVFLSGNLLLSLNSIANFASIWKLNIYLYFIYQLYIFYELISIYKKKQSK